MSLSAAANNLFAPIPSSVSMTYGGTTALTIYDTSAFDVTASGTPFENRADDRLWPSNGGTHEKSVALTLSVYDMTAASALASCPTVQGVTAVFRGRGGAAGHTKTVRLARGAVTGVEFSGRAGNEPRTANITVAGFSADGTTSPLSITIS